MHILQPIVSHERDGVYIFALQCMGSGPRRAPTDDSFLKAMGGGHL